MIYAFPGALVLPRWPHARLWCYESLTENKIGIISKETPIEPGSVGIVVSQMTMTENGHGEAKRSYVVFGQVIGWCRSVNLIIDEEAL